MTPSLQQHYRPQPAMAGPRLVEPDPAPEPSHTELCAACGRTGIMLEFDEWRDENDNRLDEAGSTPDGRWACSEICFSQAMYNAADIGTRRKLDAIADATQILDECLDPSTLAFLRFWFAGITRAEKNCAERLADEAATVRDLLSQNAEPRWLNRPTREEKLERTIEQVAGQLERGPLNSLLCAVRGYTAGHRQLCSPTWLRQDAAETAAHITSAVAQLREAVQL